jgi:CRP-like cAMP-binding protein
MEDLLPLLSAYKNLPKSQLSLVLPFFEKEMVVSKTLLLRPGEKVKYIWKIGQGMLRIFYHQEELKHTWKDGTHETVTREVTSWIVPAPGFLTDIHGFLHNKISRFYIEALEDCKLYRLSLDGYHQIQHLHPDLTLFILEQALIAATQKVQMLHLRHPMDRLNRLEKMYPGLSGKVSVKIIASYLNIDPTTLSKLRGMKFCDNKL